MANTDKVFGFKPVFFDKNKIRKFYKAAGTTVTNDMFVGDLVVVSGSGDANGVLGVSVATAGDTNPAIGVVVGFVFDKDHLNRGTWVDGADAGYPLVLIDPDAIYEAQADASLTYTDLGNNANMVQTAAGSRTAGTSGQEVDATVGTTATYQLKIVGFPQRPDNEIGAADVKVYVKINNHQMLGGTGTAGV
jgi:hypothetical protein